MTVIDIETARANAVAGTLGGVGSTTPATSAIRYVGLYFDHPGSAPGNTDNIFIDAMWRLPANTPGITVEGRNGGSTDWNWQDIVDAGDVTDTTKAWGTVFQEDGIIKLNTPIQFGENDATTHGFSDENVVIAWQDQLVASDFYGIDVIGGSGTQSFQAGLKSGAGDDAQGTQGWTITGDSAGPRWYFDADDANVDACNVYGSSLQHASNFTINSTAVSFISTFYIDCVSALISNSEQLKCSIINASTEDGYASFMTTDDMTDIVRCNFVFSDGYAIELTTPQVASQTSKGNKFTDYGITGSPDAAVYNNTGSGLVTISVTDLGDAPTYSNGPSASTLISADVTLTVTVNDLADGNPIENARVLLEAASGGAAPSYDTVSITASGTTASVAHTAHGMANGETVIIRDVDQEDYNGIFAITNVTTNAYDYTMGGSPSSPATSTATITATKGYISELTNASGIATENTGSVTQPVQGWVRKATGAPYYKQSALTGSITTSGFDQTVLMVLDQ
jgi:hypothetical protein